MAILILSEHDNRTLDELTRSAVTAARQIGGEIELLVAGAGCAAVAEQAARIDGVGRVLLVEAPAYGQRLAENLALLVRELAPRYSHLLAPASSAAKDLLPRVAALLDVGQLSEIVSVETPDTFKRPIYAGNAIATVQSLDPLKVISVRAAAFDKTPDGTEAAPIDTLDLCFDAGLSAFVGEQRAQSERPQLTAARVIVSGGRGLGAGENFALIERLADKLGAAVGASRAAVDAGFVGNDLQVGQTGKIVAPELYIAVGISGAIQHLAGMKDSRVIVAINKDEEAPIFQVADYGLVADLFEALPELESKL